MIKPFDFGVLFLGFFSDRPLTYYGGCNIQVWPLGDNGLGHWPVQVHPDFPRAARSLLVSTSWCPIILG
jgi:hypothetical protein